METKADLKILNDEFFFNEYGSTVHVTVEYKNKDYICAFQVDENKRILHAKELGYDADEYFDLENEFIKDGIDFNEIDYLESSILAFAKDSFLINR